MAKSSGLGDNFYVGGFDLSGDVASVDKISGPTALLEAASIKNFAEARIPGLRSGSMQFTTYFENSGTTTAPAVPATTVPLTNPYNWPVFVTVAGGTVTGVNINGSSAGTGDGTYVLPALGIITLTYSVAPTWTWLAVSTEHNGLKLLPRTDVVATYMRGTAQGNVAASCNGVQLNYDGTRDNTGNLTMQTQVTADKYGVEWGYQLTAGLRVDTAATVGTAYVDTAASAFGAQAYLQLVALVGTSVDVSITHSTTSGGTYTSLIDFGSMTAVGSARGSVANTATVDQYLKVVTTGTFTYAQFAVVFVRNPVVGVVF